MDATERPIKIPKDFSVYAEKHSIYETFKRLLTSLIVKMPADPLEFMLDFFQNLQEVSKVLVLGPRCSGKTTLATRLATKLNCTLVNFDQAVELDEKKSALTQELVEKKSVLAKGKNIDEWAAPIIKKLSDLERQRKGWVMDGVVKDKDQAMAVCNAGFFPTHTIILDAATNVLVARAMWLIEEGKAAKDKEKGGDEDEIGESWSRFIVSSHNREEVIDPSKVLSSLVEEVELFCHHRNTLMEAFQHSVKAFNSDQPIDDLLESVYTFVCQPHRSVIPFTPRILILGPPGTPVEQAAKELADKYKINLISCDEAKENEITKRTKLGEVFTLCQQTCSKDPDEAVFDLVHQELNNIQHHSRGWVVIGYPNNIQQTNFFAAAGHQPNRVFFLEMTNEQVMDVNKRDCEDEEEDENKMAANVKKILSKDELCYKLTNYRLHEEDLKKFYQDECFEVDSCMNLENIVQTMESIIVNPLPVCRS